MLLVLVWSAGYFGYLQLTGNFHAVIPGVVYRSAQVTPDRLRAYQGNRWHPSVINLRGENPGDAWYDSEIATASDLGIAHFDFRMSASRVLPQDLAARPIALMRAAPKPLLIHCKSGADRTGLASALFLAAIAGADEEQAERQISIRYGHLGISLLSATYPIDESWERFEEWVGMAAS